MDWIIQQNSKTVKKGAKIWIPKRGKELNSEMEKFHKNKKQAKFR